MSVELTNIRQQKDEVYRANLEEFISMSLFEWLKQFPNVKYDLTDFVFGKGTIYVYGKTSDLERMSQSPELLVEFHEMIIRIFKTTRIEYVFTD